MMWWHDGGWGAGQWLAMSLMMVLFWGLLAVAAYWVIRSLRTDHQQAMPPSPTPASPTATADQVLAERFARGEIGAEEFAERRAVLHGAAPHRDEPADGPAS